MREIKFRAWDKEEGKWLHSYKKTGGFHLFGEIIRLSDWVPFPLGQEDRIVVEQFTGLTDWKGVEIYEGDIFKWVNRRQEIIIGIIVFDNGSFSSQRIENPGFSYNLSIQTDLTIHTEPGEVIGNIHENPELIEE